ncbi:outer envelope protein 80, chloroplastic isoform X2 [Sesamum indicum]|nr:outer envelope protein 80, chloroplastic isoform X2 [Sesamum indicum]
MERGLFGMVSGAEILSGGIIKLQVSEAEVNDISIRFLDKTGEPTVGKTRPETILRQLTTKKGQVYSMIQGKRDVDTVLAMGIMDDVSIIPQPAGDTGKVDLTMNVVERKSGRGISGGGGISSGITSGPLAGLIGSIAIYHKNLFGRNQKLNLSLERGQIDSIFRINYTDPWIEGDDKRTSRAIMIQNSRTPGTLVHGNQPNNNGLTIGRITAGIEYSRPFRPKWNGTAGLIFQRAGAHDEKGIPIIRDFFGSPLTASGNTHDDMILAKLETVYTYSGDPGSSMFVFNMDQGIPVSPEWLVFNRVNARARQGFVIGPACFHVCLSGGHVVGKFPPHEAFPIGGTNSVRGYEEGALGSGRSYVVGSGEMSFPVMGPVEGAVFADYGTDLGSGSTVPGDPAGARNKPGSGYGYGIGVRVDSPLGPLRLEYAFNDQGTGRFHFGIGLRN